MSISVILVLVFTTYLPDGSSTDKTCHFTKKGFIMEQCIDAAITIANKPTQIDPKRLVFRKSVACLDNTNRPGGPTSA